MTSFSILWFIFWGEEVELSSVKRQSGNVNIICLFLFYVYNIATPITNKHDIKNSPDME